jgi:hypothetical protein
MEPITLVAIAAVAFLVLRGKKKDTKELKTYQIHYEDLRTRQQKVGLRPGDAVEVVLSGVREQWGLLVLCPTEAGCDYPLPDMLDIGVMSDRGVVTYTVVATELPEPWMVRLQFTLLGRPEGREVHVYYTPGKVT